MKDKLSAQKHLSMLERSIENLQTLEDKRNFIKTFDPQKSLHDQYSPQIFLRVWKIAFEAGKIKLANLYAQKAFRYLYELKRIPALKNFLLELHEAGLLKSFRAEQRTIDQLLLGKKQLNADDLNFFEQLCDHPEFWKSHPAFLKQYLLIEEEWNIDQWKYCYEYILTNYFDKDLFLMLLEKTRERKKKTIEEKLIKVLIDKKVKVPREARPINKIETNKSQSLNANYDDIALSLLSGEIQPNPEEQKRVINSLKFISESELSERGHDMIVAFELLGMEQVVRTLCEKLIDSTSDVKRQASIYFIWAQSFYNSEEYFKANDLIDEVMSTLPLLNDERLAFLYLKAEVCLKLRKKEQAKELYLLIKKQNPHYRLVGERLSEIEKN